MADVGEGGERRSLRDLARLHGVQTSYIGYDGQRVRAPVESLLAALRGLGVDLASPAGAQAELEHERRRRRRRLGEPVEVVWTDQDRSLRISHGEGVDPATLEVDLSPERAEGSLRLTRKARDRGVFDLPPDLPDGAHPLRITDGDRSMTATLLAAPSRCRIAPDGVGLGLWAPLYALRSEDSPGVGSYADLERMGVWCADRGADLFGTLPLLACYLDEPFDPSPYAPISRLFWNELFVDPRRTPEHESEEGRSVCTTPEFQQKAAALREDRLLDYRAAWRLIRETLEPLSEIAFRSEQRRAALLLEAERDPRLGEYVRFRAETARTGRPWTEWSDPDGVRRAPLDVDDPLQRLFLYAQSEAMRQLDEAHHAVRTRGGGLYLDLPVGVAGGGFDTWAFPEEFAEHCSIGAPPDAFFHKGQAWGFPPPQPEASRRTGHALFRRILSNHLDRCEALRIDHVMGLHRLFLVPDGAEPTEGVYLRQPAEEFWACATLESSRRNAVIIGENLGVVPEEVNRAMRKRSVLGMNVAPFEAGDGDRPLPTPTSDQLACLNTHDMPTFPAFWTGDDVDLHRRLGVLDEERIEDERRGREAFRDHLRRGLDLPRDADPESDVERALAGLLDHLARSDARILLVGLEDLLGEREPQNVPGVGAYPNWRRRTRAAIEQIESDHALARTIERLSAARRERSSTSTTRIGAGR